MTTTVACDNTYGGCCGVRELANFSIDPSYPRDYTYTGQGDSLHQAWLECLREATISNAKGIYLHVWFVKFPSFKGSFEGCEYDCNDFRKIVQRIKGVAHLAETRNPNTGNMVDGYGWINTGEIDLNAE